MTVTSYDSVEDMFEALQSAKKAADAYVQEWQRTAKAGDCFLRYIHSPSIAIYGEILDPAKPADGDTTITDEELAEDAELYTHPHMQSIRFSRCFSTACPQGELGDVHLSTLTSFLTAAQFARARELGWPSDPSVILQVLQVGHSGPDSTCVRP
jgi:hypothetical protein